MDSSHQENRRRLAALLPPGTLAVIATGRHPLPCGNDSAAPWPDFFYLTGQREPQSALILTHERTILFKPLRDARDDLWEGPDAGSDGIGDVRSMADFEPVLRACAHQAGLILVHAPENPFAPQQDHSLAGEVRRLLPLHPLDRLAPWIGRLRAEKQNDEIKSISTANDLAARAFRRAIGFIRPGVRGFEVKAEFLHEVTRHGSAGLCCPAITAAGAETLILHWRGERRPWAAEETALLDFTCEWNGLCADVARSVPVGGKFSPRQRAVYDAVARTMNSAGSILRPGRLLSDCQKDLELTLQYEILRLGLLKSTDVPVPSVPAPALRRFFMHQACHHIGYEVHDPVPAEVPLAAGQVLAVEPAIYVPAEGFGIRIENNYLVTARGTENLTRDLPVEAGEIEELVQM